jgi:hypothetical protein
MILAGLLACALPVYLPIRNWRTVVEVVPAIYYGIYSYGDSAGLSPDFPFNPHGAEPASPQM